MCIVPSQIKSLDDAHSKAGGIPSSPSYRVLDSLYMTVQGMMQHEQSSVLKQEHLPPWGLTMEPAVVEMEDAVEAGILARG
jgi:hypothetical protein